MRTGRVRSALSRIPLGRAIVALGLVFVAIDIASTVWALRAAREQTIQRAARGFSNVTHVIAEQTAATFDAVDLVLREAARTGNARMAAAGVARLRGELPQTPQVAALLVYDRNGALLARTDRDELVPGLTALHREAGANGVYMSDPYLAPDGRSWRLLLSRRFGDTESGAIAAAIELEGFDRLYHMIDLGQGAFITLMSFEGAVVARVPDPQQLRGRRVMDSAIRDRVLREGSWQGWAHSPVLNRQVLVNVSVVRGFPLFVASGAAEDAVLAPWRDEARLAFDRAALTSAAMLALTALAVGGLLVRPVAQIQQRAEARVCEQDHVAALAAVAARRAPGRIVALSPERHRARAALARDDVDRDLVDELHGRES